MRFVTFEKNGAVRAGWLKDGGIVDMVTVSNGTLPEDILRLIQNYDIYQPIIKNQYLDCKPTDELNDVKLLAPLPHPVTFRDFMCFREHPEHIAQSKGKPAQPAYYEIPVFYFSNPNTFLGPSQPVPFPKSSRYRDYEFELGFVLGKGGMDIKPEDALSHVFGMTILCDWSARDLQMAEQRLPLGPHKGKDFAVTTGPCLVTMDELMQYHVEGTRFNMEMVGFRNGNEFVRGNFFDIYHDLGAMIARASADVMLYPGEIIGSGTLGGGCLYELSADYEHTNWLSSGETIEFEVTGLGRLSMQIQ